MGSSRVQWVLYCLGPYRSTLLLNVKHVAYVVQIFTGMRALRRGIVCITTAMIQPSRFQVKSALGRKQLTVMSWQEPAIMGGCGSTWRWDMLGVRARAVLVQGLGSEFGGRAEDVKFDVILWHSRCAYLYDLFHAHITLLIGLSVFVSTPSCIERCRLLLERKVEGHEHTC